MRASTPVARLLRIVSCASLVCFAGETPLAAQSVGEGLPSYAEPGVLPDGREIAFVSGGDIWTVSSQGGAARLLVAHSANESRPLYSPDGRSLAFNSDHIASMSQGALDQLIFDLDQGNHAREGVVVDVRNNNGGFVNVYAIDILSRQNYFTMQNRGGVVAPSRVQLGQRALLAPTVLVTNQHTLSDGEDFTEGYRTLELGTVVGEPTAGWIIYTGSTGLVDGRSVRMPRTKIRDTSGQVMERNPRPVDIEVERPAGESYLDRDSQLERAVEELLRQLGVRATTSSR